MVERYVFIKLKSEHATEAGRKEVAERTLDDLDGLPGVVKLIVGTPADQHAGDAWDLSIVVVFDRYEDVAPYLSHPDHRRYVDEYLKPRLEVIKYWNFDVEVRGPDQEQD